MPGNSAHAASAGSASLADASGHTLGREIAAARAAYERRDNRALAAARAAWQGREHLLAHYVEYWALMSALGTASAAQAEEAAIRRYLATHAATPLAETLRREWLRALGRAGAWPIFKAEWARLDLDDAEIACHHLMLRMNEGDRSVESEIRALWNSARPLPEACHELFAASRAPFGFSAAEQWARVRKLLADNHLDDARRSAAHIEKLPAHFERQTASVALNAETWLASARPSLKTRDSIELFLFALQRIARADAERAALLLDKYGKALSDADRRFAWSRIATQGAIQHAPQALAWFSAAGDEALGELQASWKARAALRARDWPLLKRTIAAMEPIQQREPAWRYWLARAEAELGDAGAARALREALARESPAREGGFYALLAAEELGALPQPVWKAWKADEQALLEMAARPGIARALALARLDMRPEALREWQFATRGLDDMGLLTAAEVARRHAMPDRAIAAAERTLALHDYVQRYPMPHREELAARASARGLDEAWVYGIIRQESRFLTDARSRVGAAGLMQLMPATARWAARHTGITSAALRNLNDVPVNLTLGTFYLKHVLDDLGHPVLATAAYNAGPGRARRWRAEGPLEGAIYAETIPFNETRDYVKKVMANTWYYAHRNGHEKASLTAMLGRVPGKVGGESGQSSLINMAALAARAETKGAAR